jgi:hypothetical protein
MTYRLTYSDRESLLRAFDSLKAASGKSDKEILSAVSEWAKHLLPTFGFELGLTRDLTALMRYLTAYRIDQDVVDIARGALLYVLSPPRLRSTKVAEFALLGHAFICSYAVHEIQTRLGERATYNPPRLTATEQKRAEDLFIKCFDNPDFHDTILIDKSQSIASGLQNLSECGLFKRLHKNIDFLVSILLDPVRSLEQKSYARAALNYLACQEDAIDDRFGIIGYLDDNFILQLAVDFIEPNREPWLELLDEIVGARPFLNRLVIDDGSGGRPISEFMTINAALTCTELHGEEFPPSLLLIVPVTGPTPFLLGLISVVGLIQESGQQEVTEQSFRMGQKVLVDNHVIAEFAGFSTINGRKMFGLTQYHSQSGHRLPCTYYWPVSDLGRLVPADSSRAIRGKLTYNLSRSDTPLPALNHLFNTTRTIQITGLKKRVIVVMPVATAHDMAMKLSLYGHPIKDVVPMGHLSSEQEVRPWSSRFGQQEPLLIFVSDLDVACAFVENNPDLYHVVIVDASGRNAGKTASLRRLQHFKIPTLVVSAERLADGLSLTEDDNVGVWEWEDDDFSALLWPMLHNKNPAAGPLVKYERRLQSQSSWSPEIKSIPFLMAEQAFEDLCRVRASARRRGDEPLAELDDIVALAFGVLSRLLRSATPLTTDTPSMNGITTGLKELSTIRQRSRYLSETERLAAAKAEESLQELFLELQRENTKAEFVSEMLAEQPSLTIICPDARLCPDLERAYSVLGIRVLASCGDDNSLLEGAIIPGWFRKARMAELLIPPVTNPLYMVLYEIEHKWYNGFRREQRKARETRLAHSNRAKLFPIVKGWRKCKPGLTDSPESSGSSGLLELERIHEHVRLAYQKRFYRAARSDGSESEVPAYLFIFEGDFYGFLTESYKANVITHLLDATAEDLEARADVKQKSAGELKPGDALLFHRGSDSDVIRTAADEILPPGLRATSALWRTALLDYVTREGLSPDEVWKRLRDHGCPLKAQTIKTWLDNDSMIAPQAYDRDVRLIFELTGDKVLANRVEEVLEAIGEVRSAHLRASHQIARQVMARAVNTLKEEGKKSPLFEIESNVVVARIVDIDNRATLVRTSMTNRLLEGEQWHE